MFEFSKTINDELVSVLFDRVGSEWHVQIGMGKATPTIDLYTKDFLTNPITKWIHQIETKALPKIERDSKNYLEAKDRVRKMALHVKDIVYNRQALEENGLMSYGPVTRRSVIKRHNRVVDNFAMHVTSLEKFGLDGTLTDECKEANDLIALAFVLSQEENNKEKGGTDETQGSPRIIN